MSKDTDNKEKDVLKELNFTDLFTQMQLKEIDVRIGEGKYTFAYNALSWTKRMSIASACLDAQTETFDLGKYFMLCLFEMLDESTCPGKSPTVLAQFSPDVLDQLVTIVPSPYGIIQEVKAIKKE